MGIFFKLTPVVNVAPIPINVRFDGQDIELAPGANSLPDVAIPFGKNQNPIMGSQDPNNPHMSGARYLLRVVGTDDCTPMTAEEWADHLGRPCRMDEQVLFAEQYGGDPKARMVTHGKGKKIAAGSRYEAGTNPQGLAAFDSRV